MMNDNLIIKDRRSSGNQLTLPLGLSIIVHVLIAAFLLITGAWYAPPQLSRQSGQVITVSMVSGTQTQSEAAEKREALSARETTALPAEKKKVIAETDLSKRQVPVNVTSLAVGIRDGKEQEGISTGGNKNNVDGQMTISMPTGSTDKGNSTGEITDSSSAWPRYKANDQPSYPLFARLRGYEGTVLLSVEVLSSGLVGRMKVKASSGYESLDQSALSALEKWIFEPARQKGNPIAMWVDVPVRFSLRSRGNI